MVGAFSQRRTSSQTQAFVWLVGRYAAQRAPVEVIEMSVCNQDEINRRQMMNFEARLLQALDYLEPLRPVRIDQDVDFMGLDKK